MQGIYTYNPETNHVPKQYNVTAILSLLCMVPISLAAALVLIIIIIIIIIIITIITTTHLVTITQTNIEDSKQKNKITVN
jgi:ABC-type bacteriocin/lantibiotic exporter with double-glycine peptidase domain